MTLREHRSEPQTLGQALQALAPRRPALPPSAVCPKCEHPMRSASDTVAERLPEGRTLAEVPWCDCAAQEAERTARLYRDAGLPQGEARTFENFDVRPGTQAGVEAVALFLEGAAQALTLWGMTGRGKSHLAEAVARDALARGKRVRWAYVPALLDRMRATFNTEDASIDDVIRPLLTADLVVLDDVAVGRLDDRAEWAAEKLTEIVEARNAARKPWVATLNKSLEQLERTPYFRLASRLFAANAGVAVAHVQARTDWRTGR